MPRPSGDFRSTAIDRLPRFQPGNPGNSRNESPANDSTLMTSAPKSANIIPAYAPAIYPVRSTTRIPSSGGGSDAATTPNYRIAGPIKRAQMLGGEKRRLRRGPATSQGGATSQRRRWVLFIGPRHA